MKTAYSKIHLCLLWFTLVNFISSIYCTDEEHGTKGQPVASSKNTELNFASLSHDAGDPDAYTLVCLDSALIPSSEKLDSLKKNKELNPIRNWVRKELLEKTEKDDALEKLYVETREYAGGNNYYLVRLYLKPDISPSEYFTTRLWGGSVRQISDHQYSASMLIFPQPSSTQALAYLLGGWRQLCNPHAVIHDWGLRLAATRVIFSDENIKSLLGKNNFDSNPTSRREKKQRLAPIESFALEVGTEGLQTLTVLPKYALKANWKRLVVGSDTYRFFLPGAETGKKGDTIGSLVKMANYLYSVYRHKREIHPKLQYYLDDEVTNLEKVAELNASLSEILPTAAANLKVFPSDDIWKAYGTSPLFSFKENTGKKYLLEALNGKKLTLDSLVSIKKARSKASHQEALSRLIYTLPIELNDEFYRFDRGRWFKIAPTRFDSIIRKMRDPDVKVNIAALLPYTLEDAVGEEGVLGGLYQEDRYNRRVVAALVGKKQKGILLDRLNIYFSGKGNKFEFGDLLLYGDKGQNYIVHVKRKEAGDIDHHRAQVERCAEYLSTELKKDNAKDILLLGCVNGLYLEYGVSITGKKAKQLTSGVYFKEIFAKGKRGKASWDNYLKKTIFSNAKGQAATPCGKLKIALEGIDFNDFENYQEELIVALDALYDCCGKKKELPPTKIQEFIESIRQLIALREVLLPSGLLTAAVKRKTTIVLAVIDDRQIEPIRKAEKTLKEKKTKKDKEEFAKKVKELKAKDRKKETELFHKQQLWGLDDTRQKVQKKGFKFNLMVINENVERPDWDAFGSTKVDVKVVDVNEDSDQQETGSKKPLAKKKKVVAKKSKKEAESSSKKSDSSDDEEEQSDEEIANYQYTSTDINRLLHQPLSEDLPEDAEYSKFSLSGADVDDDADTNDIIHCLNNSRYVLPPIIAHAEGHVDKSPAETLVDLLSDSFYTHETVIEAPPKEMIIPFNPGGHWVTLQILIPEQENEQITFNYIDSLEGTLKNEVRLFLAFLKGKYLGRTIKFEPILSRIQPDGTSCGAVTVENVKDLFREVLLPDPHLISLADILALKKEHRTHLATIDQDFDFDK